METTKTKVLAILVLALGLMVCPAELAGAEPMGTGFTYQGRLVDDNSVANGQYDFQFKVFDNPDVNLGNQQGSTIYINALNVKDGNFTVELDFGSGIFYGEARWLEIGVRPAGTGSFTTLSPLQEVKPTPYSIHASYALQADEANTLNGFDSTAFASVAHSHDGVYALIGHLHDGSDIKTGTVADGLIADSIARDSEITWGNLAGIPPGFADEIDDIGGTDSDWIISLNNMYSGVAGNVGIGTSSPLSKLSVGGDGIGTTCISGVGSIRGVYGSGSTEGVLGVNSDTDSYGRLGYVNVGVYGKSSGVGVFGEDSDSGSSGYLGYGAYGGYFSGDGYFSGNVGIGTTTPDRTLEISGILRVAQEANNALGADFSYVVDEPVTGHDGLIIDSSTGAGWSDIHLRTIGTTKLFVESGGNVGIGTTSPGAKLEVDGDLKVTGAYKGNIGPNNGAPFPQPAYDSGWVSISAGSDATLTHNIGGNADNYVVDMQFKQAGSPSHGRHMWGYGGDVWPDGSRIGAYWHNLTTSSIKVYRNFQAGAADQIRIRIWMYN